jgi:hypothetical protein
MAPNDITDGADRTDSHRETAAIETESGELVLYDVENGSAWIQSDAARDLAEVR